MIPNRKRILNAKDKSRGTTKQIKSRIMDCNPMHNVAYIQHSSNIIRNALNEGSDVLQFANGDIVITATITIVTRYVWDQERSKLIKVKNQESYKQETIEPLHKAA